MKKLKIYIMALIALFAVLFGLNMCGQIGEGMSRDIISGDVSIYGRYTITSSTMTINPGAEVSFGKSGATGCEQHEAEFRVSTDAAVKARGTALLPITFTGTGSLIIEATSRNDSRFEHCDFGTIDITVNNPSVTFSSCTKNGQPYP
jgi:hypothetical protein